MNIKKRLSRKFYNQSTLKTTRELLGKIIIRKIGTKTLLAKIVETEAYIGQNDKASHSFKGETKRNAVMFEEGGKAYVYFIYGMYWMFNIVTEEKDKPCAVLIRAVQPINLNMSDKELKILGSGPGRLCRFLKIDGKLNNEDLTVSDKLYVLDSGEALEDSEIIRTARIGVGYAGRWAKEPWRFYIKNNPFVSQI